MEKANFVNWYSPKSKITRNFDFDLRVRKPQKSNGYVMLNHVFVRANDVDPEKPFKVAIVFDNAQPFLTIEPIESVPSVVFELPSTRAKSPTHTKIEMVREFEKRFNIDFDDEDNHTVDFTLTKWDKFNGMQLFKIDLKQ